ncbi:hypothetical protein RhiLY_01730 [Ceratobasidium sp. AG-Ba]|nr:hypothetical protein RhiLY_01730 [Ceratobasidium sp. AG-Ba]
MSSPTSLAQITVQVDALAVIRDVEEGLIEAEDFWVSCYETNKSSVHGKVRVTIDDQARDRCAFVGREGVQCKQLTKNTLQISCLALRISSRTVQFPARTITLPPVPTTKTSSKLDYGITSLDVSSDGQTWAAGLGNGSVVLCAGTKGEAPSITIVHKASVSDIKLVDRNGNDWKVLSASEDFTLSLSSLSPTPSAPLRLTSHTRALTSVSLLSSSSQAVSAGKDGTLRIWDISPSSDGKHLGMIRSLGDVPINSISASSSGTIVAMALQSGCFELVDLNTKTTIYTSSTSKGALEAIALYTLSEADSRYFVVTGSRNGTISFYVCAIRDGGVDIKDLGSCIRNGAGVSDIKLVQSKNLYPTALVTTTDGLPYHLQRSDSGEFQVLAEYAGGADCSPIRTIVESGGKVWMAGDDGVIWMYDL